MLAILDILEDIFSCYWINENCSVLATFSGFDMNYELYRTKMTGWWDSNPRPFITDHSRYGVVSVMLPSTELHPVRKRLL